MSLPGKNMPYCCLQLLLRLTLFGPIFKAILLFLKIGRTPTISSKELKYKIICFIREEKKKKKKSWNIIYSKASSTETLLFSSWLTVLIFRCLVVQLCLTLCDPMDCTPPGSTVHGDSPSMGILQARILEWTAMPSSGIFPTQGSNPGLPTLQQDSWPSEPPWSTFTLALLIFFVNTGWQRKRLWHMQWGTVVSTVNSLPSLKQPK